MNIPYGLLADIVAFIHFLYLAFVVVGELLIIIGGILSWDWIRSIPFRLIHLASIAVVAVQAALGVLCPLTIWEYRLREAAGQHAEWDITFVGRLLRSVIYYEFPEWFFLLLYIGFAGLVVATLIIFPPKRKRNRR